MREELNKDINKAAFNPTPQLLQRNVNGKPSCHLKRSTIPVSSQQKQNSSLRDKYLGASFTH